MFIILNKNLLKLKKYYKKNKDKLLEKNKEYKKKQDINQK
jgi:hypothetical protein